LSCAEFDEDGYVPACTFAADVKGEGVRAEAVDVIGLGVAGFAAAVETVVVLLVSIGSWSCEDSGK